jgi:hypothetical protein
MEVVVVDHSQTVRPVIPVVQVVVVLTILEQVVLQLKQMQPPQDN